MITNNDRLAITHNDKVREAETDWRLICTAGHVDPDTEECSHI